MENEMTHYFKILFITILSLGVGQKGISATAIQIKLVSLPVNQWESDRLQNFFSSVNKIIPTSIKEVLTQEIALEFRDISLDSPPLQNSAKINFGLLDRKCLQEDIFITEPKEINTEILRQVQGHVPIAASSEQKIVLHKLFLNEIFKGESNSTSYKCGHKNSYQLAQARLIHELGHLYDLQKKISYDRRFRHLTTFKSNLFSFEQKNKRLDRSPDIYEMVEPKESFAVNLEYFLLDSEYKCRRPALFQYYKEKLNHEPFPKSSCKINKTVEVNGFVVEQMSLDPELLYRVDYLLADKGTSVESRFGHSMLRLMFCPSRYSSSEACLKDTSKHVVVSFRANMFDENTESSEGSFSSLNYILKGLGFKGGFPSIMYLFQMSLIQAEYNHYDLRDLVSTPLALNLEEKRDLIYRILEIYHGYSGSYQFFTNNCKTETEDLLKAIMRNPLIEKLNKLTPVNMRQKLIDLNLADKSQELTYRSLHHALFNASEDFKHNFNIFYTPAKATRMAKFLNFADFKDKETLIDYINKFSANERRSFHLAVHNSFLHKDEGLYKTIIGSLLSFESSTLLYYRFEIIKNTLMFFESLKTDINQLKNKLDEEKFNMLKTLLNTDSNKNEGAKSKLSAERISRIVGPVYKGYGITLPKDLILASVSINRPELSPFAQKVIADALISYLDHVVAELSQTKENMSLLRKLITANNNENKKEQ